MNESLESLSRSGGKPLSGKRRAPAWLVPAGIALGFALLFLGLFRDRLIPADKVQVALVLAVPGGVQAAQDTPSTFPADAETAFQASGWVEPDPLPIKATALVDGVIDRVHVLEGEQVEEGQLLATLIAEDFQLALDAAKEALEMRLAAFSEHQQEIISVNLSVEAAKARVDTAIERVTETADMAARIEGLPKGALPESEVVAIRSAHRAAKAGEAEARATLSRAEAEVMKHVSKILILGSQYRSALVEVKQAELAMSRTQIKAPVAGRVLRLLAAPGQKRMLGMDDADSATVAILYEPEHLQVRVDVPLADAAGLQIGQHAKIRCNLLPDEIFQGVVTRITGEADLQRNTLQAKVRIDDPSDQLRPEMLCRVEFLAAGREPETSGKTASGALVTWVPTRALEDGQVWVCDPEAGRVEQRKVRLGNESRDGFSRIDKGLRPGEWVVLGPGGLRDGQRVNPQLVTP